MLIKRFLESDADTISGGNEGTSLDPDPLYVNDHNDALYLCRSAIIRELGRVPFEPFIPLGGTGFAVTTEFLDNSGNQIPREEFFARNEEQEFGSAKYISCFYEVVEDGE